MHRSFASCASVVIAITAFFSSYSIVQAKDNSDKKFPETLSAPIYGWVEAVRIYPHNLRLKAKLDTGAKTSSLNALNIKEIKRGGDAWVTFNVPTQDEKDKVIYKLKVQRFVKIVRHSGHRQRRPVVHLDVCLGGKITPNVEFSLIDRSELIYPVLLGRDFLKGNAVVDVAKTFTEKPTCNSDKP